jgi:small subunit ribosomal protein S7
MSRRHRAEKREVLPDAKFGDVVLTKFMNCLMIAGKKSTAERIVYGALDLVKDSTNQDPVETFHEAINNVKPQVEVRSRRVGGATYQVPMEVRSERQLTLAIRWLVADMRSRRDKEAKKKLQMALLDAANNRGGAIKKREDTHKMAEANRAFSHFRW